MTTGMKTAIIALPRSPAFLPPTKPATSEPTKGIQKSRISSTNIQTMAELTLPPLVGLEWLIVEVATGTP
jgi:hypothetical protein